MSKAIISMRRSALSHRLSVGVASANPRLDSEGGSSPNMASYSLSRCLRSLDGKLRQARLVEDGHRRAIGHRLGDGVDVYERAKAPYSATLVSPSLSACR